MTNDEKIEVRISKFSRVVSISSLFIPIIAVFMTWIIMFVVFFAGQVSDRVFITFFLVSYSGISIAFMLSVFQMCVRELRQLYIALFIVSFVLTPILLWWWINLDQNPKPPILNTYWIENKE